MVRTYVRQAYVRVRCLVQRTNVRTWSVRGRTYILILECMSYYTIVQDSCHLPALAAARAARWRCACSHGTLPLIVLTLPLGEARERGSRTWITTLHRRTQSSTYMHDTRPAPGLGWAKARVSAIGRMADGEIRNNAQALDLAIGLHL